MVEKFGRELVPGPGEQTLGLLGGILVSAVVTAGALALPVIPMGNGVNRFILRGPLSEGS